MNVVVEGREYRLLRPLDWYDLYLSGVVIRRFRLHKRSGYVLIDFNRDDSIGYAVFPDDFLDFLWHIPTVEKESLCYLFDDFTFYELYERAIATNRIGLDLN